MDIKSMSDAEILDRLLAVDPENVPTQEVYLKRLGIPVTLRALQEDLVERLRRRATYTVKGRSGPEERLDQEQYGLSLICAATVRPNWADERLLARYKASGPEQVLKRLLLPGELERLSDIVLDLSGYQEGMVEEVKNESAPEA